MNTPVGRYGFAVVLVGVFAISISSILVRNAQREGIDSVAIAFWRVAFATGILWLAGSPWKQLGRPHTYVPSPATFMAGGFLAAHFILWMVALERLSVAVCAALLATSPIWVGLLSLLLFRERIGALAWAGAITTISASVLLLSRNDISAVSTTGVWMSLGSALSFAGYLICGRQMRGQRSLQDYFLGVTASSAMIMLVYTMVVGTHLDGFTTTGWACLVALAAVPHILGHGALNWAARRMSVFPVASASLAEPVCAAGLAWILLGEAVSPKEVPLLLVILVGVAMAFWGSRRAIRP